MMMENEQSSLFSITFFNGETELDMGNIPITPSLTFKSFLSLISEKLKISPDEIIVFFQRKNFIPSFNQNYHRHRLAITRNFNFSSIMTESNSAFFWVVQTQSRGIRKRRVRNPPAMNLRRILEMFEEEENERILMSLSLDSNVINDLRFLYGYRVEFPNVSADGASSSSSSGGGRSIQNNRTCNVCKLSAVIGVETSHCCKIDASSGPIGPDEKLQPSGSTMDTIENRGKQRMD